MDRPVSGKSAAKVLLPVDSAIEQCRKNEVDIFAFAQKDHCLPKGGY
jgi:hypothetical protein